MEKRFVENIFTKEMIEKGIANNFKTEMRAKGYEVILQREYKDSNKTKVLVVMENKDIYVLGQMPRDEKEELLKCETDEELENLGYHYYNQLINVEGYESFFERLHIAYKINEDSREVYTVVFFDIGNTYISIDSTNVYVPELIKSLNENAKPKERNKKTTDTIDYESMDRF